MAPPGPTTLHRHCLSLMSRATARQVRGDRPGEAVVVARADQVLNVVGARPGRVGIAVRLAAEVVQPDAAVLAVHHRGRIGRRPAPDLREALLDAGEQPLEPIDLEIGMNAALHQHAGAAHLEGLGDLLVDFFEVEDVAFVRARIGLAGTGQRTVEGAEGAVLGAVVGVVNVAIDDVGDHALGVQAAAHGVGLESQTDQVGRVEVIEGLLARDRHGLILQGLRD